VAYRLSGGADPADVVAVLSLAAAAEPRCGATRVIAVDGPSGSGKTSLAAAVAARLDAAVVHMDDLYPGWDGLTAGVDAVTEQILEPLARGERAAYRRWDWHRDGWGETVPIPATGLLVLEGCGASVLPAGAYAAVRVWVDAPTAVRRERGIARDGDAYAPHWERWRGQEIAMFAADGTRDRADLIVDTTPPDTAPM
jgi:uridine kinase